MAHVCHMSPQAIDECPFPDFLILSTAAEKWLEVELKRPAL